MTAANTVARSSGAVLLVRKPKIDEPAPVPMPEENTHIISSRHDWNIESETWSSVSWSERIYIIITWCELVSFQMSILDLAKLCCLGWLIHCNLQASNLLNGVWYKYYFVHTNLLPICLTVRATWSSPWNTWNYLKSKEIKKKNKVNVTTSNFKCTLCTCCTPSS